MAKNKSRDQLSVLTEESSRAISALNSSIRSYNRQADISDSVSSSTFGLVRPKGPDSRSVDANRAIVDKAVNKRNKLKERLKGAFSSSPGARAQSAGSALIDGFSSSVGISETSALTSIL